MTTHVDPSTSRGDALAPATLHVCVTCRRPGDGDDHPRAGARLRDALAAANVPGITSAGVDGRPNCMRGCTAALSGPGRWTYVYGDLDPDLSPEAILEGARRYATSPDGLVPWRERPEIFRKGVIARVPAPVGASS